MSDQAPLSVNKGELARLFRVSVPTIDRWIQQGCPIIEGGSNGVAYQFDVRAVKAWRGEVEERERQAATERQEQLNAAQAELFGAGEQLAPQGIDNIVEFLNAERLALMVGKQKGELVAREDVRNDYAAMFGVMRQQMLGWAATLARTAGLTPEQQQEAEKLVRTTLVAMHGQIKDPSLRPTEGYAL